MKNRTPLQKFLLGTLDILLTVIFGDGAPSNKPKGADWTSSPTGTVNNSNSEASKRKQDEKDAFLAQQKSML